MQQSITWPKLNFRKESTLTGRQWDTRQHNSIKHNLDLFSRWPFAMSQKTLRLGRLKVNWIRMSNQNLFCNITPRILILYTTSSSGWVKITTDIHEHRQTNTHHKFTYYNVYTHMSWTALQAANWRKLTYLLTDRLQPKTPSIHAQFASLTTLMLMLWGLHRCWERDSSLQQSAAMNDDLKHPSFTGQLSLSSFRGM